MRSSKLSLAMLLASASIAAASVLTVAVPRSLRQAFKPERLVYRNRSKRYPQMVASSDEAIALHNATVSTRQIRRHRARHA